MSGPSLGAASVTVLDEAALAARSAAALRVLFPAYASLEQLLTEFFDWRLDGEHAAAFGELISLVWLGSGLTLPCCADDDEDQVRAWCAYVESVRAGITSPVPPDAS